MRRAPLVPIGFLVTWQMMLWPVRSSCSIRASRGRPPEAAPGRLAVVVGRGRVDLVSVVVEVAPVQHGVLRRADIDKGCFHAGQHVLHTAQVDVAVDLCGVVGGARNVVLDQGAALEDGDLGGGRADVDRHEVAPERPVAAFQAGLVRSLGPVAARPPRPPADRSGAATRRQRLHPPCSWPPGEPLRPAPASSAPPARSASTGPPGPAPRHPAGACGGAAGEPPAPVPAASSALLEAVGTSIACRAPLRGRSPASLRTRRLGAGGEPGRVSPIFGLATGTGRRLLVGSQRSAAAGAAPGGSVASSRPFVVRRGGEQHPGTVPAPAAP